MTEFLCKIPPTGATRQKEKMERDEQVMSYMDVSYDFQFIQKRRAGAEAIGLSLASATVTARACNELRSGVHARGPNCENIPKAQHFPLPLTVPKASLIPEKKHWAFCACARLSHLPGMPAR